VTQSVNVGNGIDKAPAEPRLQGGCVCWGGPTDTHNTTIFYRILLHWIPCFWQKAVSLIAFMRSGSNFANNCRGNSDHLSAPLSMDYPNHKARVLPAGSWFSRNTNKMQLCNRIYYSKVYWRPNMFRATHRSSSGALNCVCSLWFIYCNKVKDFVYIIHSPYYNITVVFLI